MLMIHYEMLSICNGCQHNQNEVVGRESIAFTVYNTISEDSQNLMTTAANIE